MMGISTAQTFYPLNTGTQERTSSMYSETSRMSVFVHSCGVHFWTSAALQPISESKRSSNEKADFESFQK